MTEKYEKGINAVMNGNPMKFIVGTPEYEKMLKETAAQEFVDIE